MISLREVDKVFFDKYSLTFGAVGLLGVLTCGGAIAIEPDAE
jgi:hypothetical protein